MDFGVWERFGCGGFMGYWVYTVESGTLHSLDQTYYVELRQ